VTSVKARSVHLYGHDFFDVLADRLTRPPRNAAGKPTWTGGNISWALVGEVLSRVAVNTPPVISRASIVDGDMLRVKLPLSEGSVNKATTSLLARELLLEDRSADLPDRRGGIGRRPIPLRLNHTRWFTVGVHVDERPDTSVRLTAVATTIDDRVLTEPLEIELTAGAIAGDHATRTAVLSMTIARLVGEVLDDKQLQARRLDKWLPWLGVGVVIGSPVHEGDTVPGAVNLQQELVDLLNIPVVVDNDANALAVRETYGTRVTERDFALVLVADAGVGSAFTVGGRVYRGSRGRAGEIGHIKVSPPGAEHFAARCSCQRGPHVDTYATPASIRRARQTAGREVYRTAGSALGQGIASLVDVVNPAQIVVFLPPVLAGQEHPEYRRAMHEELEQAFSAVRGGVLAGEDFTWDNVTLARAAAVRVFIEFIDHLCGLDGCLPITETQAGHRLGARDVVPIAGALMSGAVGAVVGGAIGSAWRMAGQRIKSVPLDDWSRERRRSAPPSGRARLGDAADLSHAPF
jgi:predicted NBD/HSP70 family sugar kinase